MTAEAAFKAELSRLRRYLGHRRLARLLTLSTVTALGLNLVAVLCRKFGVFDGNGPVVTVALILVSITSVWVALKFKGRQMSAELVDIDTRMSLNDLLSTAYEYSATGKDSSFNDRMYLDARHVIGGLDKRNVYPRRFVTHHVLILFFAMALIFIHWIDFPSLNSTIDGIDSLVGDSGGNTGTPPESMPPGGLESFSMEEFKERIQSMAEAMRSGYLSRQAFENSVQSLAGEARFHQERLANDLAEALAGEGFPGASANDSLRQDAVGEESLNRLRREVDAFFDGDIPESVENSLSDMENMQKSIQYLDQPERDNAGDGNTPETQFSITRKENPVDMPGTQPVPPEDQGGDAVPSDGGVSDDPAMASSNRGAGPSEDRGDLEALHDRNGEEGGGSAGTGAAGGKERDDTQIPEAQGPGISEKGRIMPGREYKISVRAFPSPNPASLLPEMVFREYSRQVESVIDKEDVPLNYRNFIKNYFISIGLRKESENDNAQ
ncbi:MAG: hypothetical protein HKM93_11635 [Desulfobacteraceae bacterium]|nr:hypothetical protein [Desulfobacteraceae bacterium]